MKGTPDSLLLLGQLEHFLSWELSTDYPHLNAKQIQALLNSVRECLKKNGVDYDDT